jgi:hypothetical protein
MHTTCKPSISAQFAVRISMPVDHFLTCKHHACTPPQECSYIEQLTPYQYKINLGFVPNMRVPGMFYVNDRLKGLLFEELQASVQRGEHGGFLPAVKQIANVAALPGIVQVRWLLLLLLCWWCWIAVTCMMRKKRMHACMHARMYCLRAWSRVPAPSFSPPFPYNPSPWHKPKPTQTHPSPSHATAATRAHTPAEVHCPP